MSRTKEPKLTRRGSYNLQIRLNADDHRTLLARAEEVGMPPNEYIRLLIRRAQLHVTVTVSMDPPRKTS